MLSWIAEIVKSSAKQVKGGDEQQQQPPEANRSLHAIESRMFKPLETRLGATRKSVRRRYVSIRNEAMHIWTLSVTQEQDQQRTPLVLLHGFAAGVAVWLPNVEALSSSSGREWSRSLYAFDLLGFGRSTRAKFSADPIVALSQFVESVEDWRRAMHLPEMILLAHGFGAYVATAYAIKYPAHAVALILVSVTKWTFIFMKTLAFSFDQTCNFPIKFCASFSFYFNHISLFFFHLLNMVQNVYHIDSLIPHVSSLVFPF